jgi:hypothetical protein
MVRQVNLIKTIQILGAQIASYPNALIYQLGDALKWFQIKYIIF